MKVLRAIVAHCSVAVMLFALWWWWSDRSASFYFPPVPTILRAFEDAWLFERVVPDLIPSALRLLVGFGLAVVVGIGVGLFLGSSRLAYRSAFPVMEFLRALPPPALLPFGLLVFGVGNQMKIIVIALGCVWPILLNTIQGVRSIDPTYADVNRVYRASFSDRILLTTLPAAAPHIFAGLRSALSIAVILMVISEMVASTNGVGFALVHSQRTFAIPEMWAAIIVLGLMGVVLNLVLVSIQSRVLAWHAGAQRSALSQPTERPSRRVARRQSSAPAATAQIGNHASPAENASPVPTVELPSR